MSTDKTEFDKDIRALQTPLTLSATFAPTDYIPFFLGNDDPLTDEQLNPYRMNQPFLFVGTGLFRSVDLAFKLRGDEHPAFRVVVVDNSTNTVRVWEEIKAFFRTNLRDDIDSFMNGYYSDEQFVVGFLDLINQLQYTQQILRTDTNAGGFVKYMSGFFEKNSISEVRAVIDSLTVVMQDWADVQTFKTIRDTFPNQSIVVYASNIINYVDSGLHHDPTNILLAIESMNPCSVFCTNFDEKQKRPTKCHIFSNTNALFMGTKLKINNQFIHALESVYVDIQKDSPSTRVSLFSGTPRLHKDYKYDFPKLDDHIGDFVFICHGLLDGLYYACQIASDESLPEIVIIDHNPQVTAIWAEMQTNTALFEDSESLLDYLLALSKNNKVVKLDNNKLFGKIIQSIEEKFEPEKFVQILSSIKIYTQDWSDSSAFEDIAHQNIEKPIIVYVGNIIQDADCYTQTQIIDNLKVINFERLMCHQTTPFRPLVIPGGQDLASIFKALNLPEPYRKDPKKPPLVREQERSDEIKDIKRSNDFKDRYSAVFEQEENRILREEKSADNSPIEESDNLAGHSKNEVRKNRF